MLKCMCAHAVRRLQRNADQLMHAPLPGGGTPLDNSRGNSDGKTGGGGPPAAVGTAAGSSSAAAANGKPAHPHAVTPTPDPGTEGAAAQVGAGTSATAAAAAAAAAAATPMANGHPPLSPASASTGKGGGGGAAGGANAAAAASPGQGAGGGGAGLDVVKVMREAAGQLAELADVLVVEQPANKVASDLGGWEDGHMLGGSVHDCVCMHAGQLKNV
eukprot:1160775-Pelagomonas_calceolata.AAC.8